MCLFPTLLSNSAEISHLGLDDTGSSLGGQMPRKAKDATGASAQPPPLSEDVSERDLRKV